MDLVAQAFQFGFGGVPLLFRLVAADQQQFQQPRPAQQIRIEGCRQHRGVPLRIEGLLLQPVIAELFKDGIVGVFAASSDVAPESQRHGYRQPLMTQQGGMFCVVLAGAVDERQPTICVQGADGCIITLPVANSPHRRQVIAQIGGPLVQMAALEGKSPEAVHEQRPGRKPFLQIGQQTAGMLGDDAVGRDDRDLRLGESPVHQHLQPLEIGGSGDVVILEEEDVGSLPLVQAQAFRPGEDPCHPCVRGQPVQPGLGKMRLQEAHHLSPPILQAVGFVPGAGITIHPGMHRNPLRGLSQLGSQGRQHRGQVVRSVEGQEVHLVVEQAGGRAHFQKLPSQASQQSCSSKPSPA